MLQASTGGVIATPSYTAELAMPQEIIGRTANVPGQEAIKLAAVPQFAITLMPLCVPSLGLSQSIGGDPSHLTLVAVAPLPQAKAGGVIGSVS